jgi:hypothetical protein
MAAVHEDPDVRQLLELLSLLPAANPMAPAQFWRDFSDAVGVGHAEYYCQKIGTYLERVTAPEVSSHVLGSLATYVLMFFTVEDSPGALKVLDKLLHADSAVDGAFGKVWARSVCDVAVKVYARYPANG